jgi:hypothetical protein
MSRDGRRSDGKRPHATAPFFDSTASKALVFFSCEDKNELQAAGTGDNQPRGRPSRSIAWAFARGALSWMKGG